MCGRFTLRAPASLLAEQFGLFDLGELAPRFNIAPGQSVAAVRHDPAAHHLQWARLRWGLVPRWADDPAIGYRMINARGETVATKPAFRAAFKERRCLLPADGFYEWEKRGREKRPYFISLRGGRPFAFAGLWETWQRGDQLVESCTVVTTQSNELLRELHERMPVILPESAYDFWLEAPSGSGGRLAELLKPFPSEEMEFRPVSSWVNSAAHEGDRCLGPPESPTLF